MVGCVATVQPPLDPPLGRLSATRRAVGVTPWQIPYSWHKLPLPGRTLRWRIGSGTST